MRPGVNITSSSSPPTRNIATRTGTAFMAGIAERGPTDRAVRVRNMTEYERWFGQRLSWTATLYDSVDATLRTGTSEVWVVRVVGPGADKDTVTLDDAGALDAITVESIGAGATDLTAEILAGDAAGTYRIRVALAGATVQTSPDLADNAAAVEWGMLSPYVNVLAVGANDPAVVAATPLAGGDDDRGNVTDVEKEAALALFVRDLGPGQVLYPGATTATMHAALADFAELTKRFAVADLPDSAEVATLTGANDADRAATVNEARIFTVGGPWPEINGVIRGTRRVVPPSAIVAGLMAANDGRTGNPNDPAAGEPAGVARLVLGLTQPAFSDDDYTVLNAAGVNVFRMIDGQAQLYGYRTLVDPEGPDAGWLSAGAARLRMAIEWEADALARPYVFKQIDGRGRLIKQFQGALSGALLHWWDLGALYGATAAEAFIVDVGPAVNTPETIEAGELHARIGIKTSPFAEVVFIDFVKVPITEALAA